MSLQHPKNSCWSCGIFLLQSFGSWPGFLMTTQLLQDHCHQYFVMVHKTQKEFIRLTTTKNSPQLYNTFANNSCFCHLGHCSPLLVALFCTFFSGSLSLILPYFVIFISPCFSVFTFQFFNGVRGNQIK